MKERIFEVTSINKQNKLLLLQGVLTCSPVKITMILVIDITLRVLTQLYCETGGESQCILTLIIVSAVSLLVLFTLACILLRQALAMLNVFSFSVFSRRGWVSEGFHGHYKSILCNSYSRPSSKLFG
jgi:hypothetical protein